MKYTITFTSDRDKIYNDVHVFKNKDDMISYLLDFVDECTNWNTELKIE